MSRSSPSHRLVVGAAALLAAFLPSHASHAASTASPDFNFHIRPLLSDRCFPCHGPDDKSRKGGFDLHTRDAALRGGKSRKPALSPGRPDDSEILRRLVSEDPDEVMPPPESKLPPLTAGDVDQIRRWITQGAPYKEHWAFLPLTRIAVPEPRSATSPALSPIDRFVFAGLEAAQLRPQPEASRETLIRRLSLDLTGLPPTLAEIDAFLADTTPAAYGNLVDRLLRSPRYGEWMAVEWMDLARYADTYGYQADVDRDLSPWRDWVIRAFNGNLPWDKFITWQLAGDLLDKPSRDQVLATAFNRLHRQTNEGGSIDEEFRVEYVSDRVHTAGTAFLGLTLECARCHDHKYDPISMRDYYSLSGFFNSIDESGLYSHFTRATPTPVLLLWEGDAEQRHEAAVDAIGAAARNLASERDAARSRFEAWRSTPPPRPPVDTLPKPVAHLRFDEMNGNRTPDAASTNLAHLHDGPALIEGRVGKAMKFSGDNSLTLPHAGKFGRTDPFSFSLWLQPTEPQTRAVILHASRAWSDSGSRGYELLLDEGRPSFALIHFWPGNGLSVRTRDPLPLRQWSHLAITYDGSSRADGVRVFVNGTPAGLEIVRDHLYKDIQHRSEWGDSDVGGVHLALAGRFRDNGFKNGLIDDLQVFDVELVPAEIHRLAAPDTAEPTPVVDFEVYLARIDPAWRTASTALREARRAENNLITPVREIMVMEELPSQRPTFVLKRGAYDARGEPVQPGVPERLLPFDPGLPRNRLGLARWITNPGHPLTARVAVNRIWKLHFGRGLVPTTWDFGTQGQLPSHPGLLDWLARRFIDSGWDRKALHKEIVMSATYRQASTAPPAVTARDPENRLLGRGPSHRLSAEQIRDSALAASGLLVPTIGGPSVKPYQPPGVWEEAGTGKTYTQDKGDKLRRRSLYTFWRRTAPPPSMLTFDATTREVCTAKRETTATPLQSLVLLNDVQFLEAARAMAEQLVARHPDHLDARITEAFRRVAGRSPLPREREILRQLHAEQLEYFRNSPGAADRYLSLGEHPRNPALPAPDVAASAVLASTLMNHDEFVMKR